MPRGDGTGPEGAGPRTGWGRGPCGSGFRRAWSGLFGRRQWRHWADEDEKRALDRQEAALKEDLARVRKEKEALEDQK